MVLPKSQSIKKIQQEFKDSNYMVPTAKKLVAEKESLSSPYIKPEGLPPAPANLIF
jgi:hypothetical protein